MAGHEKLVLVLRDDCGGIIICDEYYPTDNGRVHLLGSHSYASFDSTEGALDYKKVSIEVREVFRGTEWPEPLAGCRDNATLIAFFKDYPHGR